jgi:hypothetical protein
LLLPQVEGLPGEAVKVDVYVRNTICRQPRITIPFKWYRPDLISLQIYYSKAGRSSYFISAKPQANYDIQT